MLRIPAESATVLRSDVTIQMFYYGPLMPNQNSSIITGRPAAGRTWGIVARSRCVIYRKGLADTIRYSDCRDQVLQGLLQGVGKNSVTSARNQLQHDTESCQLTTPY